MRTRELIGSPCYNSPSFQSVEGRQAFDEGAPLV